MFVCDLLFVTFIIAALHQQSVQCISLLRVKQDSNLDLDPSKLHKKLFGVVKSCCSNTGYQVLHTLDQSGSLSA